MFDRDVESGHFGDELAIAPGFVTRYVPPPPLPKAPTPALGIPEWRRKLLEKKEKEMLARAAASPSPTSALKAPPLGQPSLRSWLFGDW